MRGRMWLFLMLGSWLVAPALSGQDVEPDLRPGIAVLPFTSGGVIGPDREDLSALEVGLQQLLLTELAQSEDLRVVERSALNEILRELELTRSDLVDPATAARVGRIVGARYAITGVFMDVFGDFRMDGRIVNVETTEIMRAVEVRGSRDGIYGMLVSLASRIMQGVELPPLGAAQREAREGRRIPAHAVILYSRAQVYEDGGRTDEAIELYRQIATEFPEMTEAREALEQLTALELTLRPPGCGRHGGELPGAGGGHRD
jgi:TolB-like protein